MAYDDATDSGKVTAPAAAAGDLSQGYCIKLYVYGDGSYGAGAPEALTPDEVGGGGSLDSIGAALKAVLETVKQNPVGGDANTQLEAGYGAR